MTTTKSLFLISYFCRCKAHNLRNTLNLHPASGIQKWEVTYHEMVKAMGLNEATVRIRLCGATQHDNYFYH